MKRFSAFCRAIALVAGCSSIHCVALADENESATAEPIRVQIRDQAVPLVPPTLTGELDADQQQRLITPVLRGLPFRQFVRDSIVAPVRIHLSYIKDASGSRIGHNVQVMFVVHASLETFSSDDFAESLSEESDGPATPEPMDAIAKTLQELGIDDAGQDVRYQRVKFDLLERIQFDGLVRIAHTESKTQNRMDLSLVQAFDNRWIDTEEQDRRGPYSGLRGWLTATELVGYDAVLIEARVVFHEPADWFRGDNFLRSKLPLVLQEAARNLRRRLIKKRSAEGLDRASDKRSTF